MKKNPSLIISIIAIIFALLGVFRLIGVSSKRDIDISSYIKKYNRVKENLKDINVLGYVYNGDFDIMNFYLAQYALAPVVLLNNPDMQFLIGNFGRSTYQFIKESIQPKYQVVKNFGNGIFLLKLRKE